VADGRPDPAVSDYRGLFAALLEHSHDGIIVSAVSDGWMLECSRSWEQMTGYARADLLGRTSVELGLIEPRVRDEAVATVRSARHTGLHETPLRRRDGTLRLIEFSTQLLSGDDLLLSIARDITERRGPA
jgi:PAS domain S-box-containing protein